ncbi:MAG: serine/threonine protein kinase, partial [Deltaproteobacteria bacterium]|nr:serine/threonine protein kinase [Deltaproteobacteria bacterium]
MGAVPQRETPFGRYVLLSKIATGGMAEIFLARDARASPEQLLVIKRILPHLGENQEFVQMFLDEARLAHHLRHPNVISLFDVGAVDDQYFIAMELLRGMDLRRLMRKVAKRDEWIPLEVAVTFAMLAAEGLHHAHECRDERGRPLGIVHRDVSPQNVFATVDGQVKVLDFGIAKAESRLTETRTGVLKGKYSYMSPEQASSGQVDRRSDVFALGVILFELLTNRRLFKRDNEILTLKAVIDDPIPPASELRDAVPPALDRIVSGALARNPKNRYPTALAFSEDLQRWAASSGLRLGSVVLTPYVTALCADEPDPTTTASTRSTQGYVSFVRRNDDEPPEPGSASSRVERIGQTGRSRRERSRVSSRPATSPGTGPVADRAAASRPAAGDDDVPTFDGPLMDDHTLDAPTLAFRSYEEAIEADVPPTLRSHAAHEVPPTAPHSVTPVLANALETRPTLPPPLMETTGPLAVRRGRWVLPVVALASVMVAVVALVAWRVVLAVDDTPSATTTPQVQTAAPAFGAIVVQSDVPATAFVDGEPAGPTPALVPGLSVGRPHRVTVRAEGREASQDVVLQREGDMATVRLVLARVAPVPVAPQPPATSGSSRVVTPAATPPLP